MGQQIVVIYGPPAAGKLTVATELAAMTGFKLFHNHLTVNAVRSIFEFGSPEYVEAVGRIRVDLLRAAAEAGVDVLSTFVNARRRETARPGVADRYAARVEHEVRGVGGRVSFVQLCPPIEVLEKRVLEESRAAHGKLNTLDGFHRNVAELEWYDKVHDDDLSIDNSHLPPRECAERIVKALELPA